MAETSRTWLLSDDVVKRVVLDEALGEKLAREEAEVIVNRLNLRLMVEMLHRSSCMSSSGNAQTLVLCSLELGDMRRLQIRRVNGSRIADQRRRQASISDFQVLLIVAPIRTREGLHDF